MSEQDSVIKMPKPDNVEFKNELARQFNDWLYRRPFRRFIAASVALDLSINAAIIAQVCASKPINHIMAASVIMAASYIVISTNALALTAYLILENVIDRVIIKRDRKRKPGEIIETKIIEGEICSFQQAKSEFKAQFELAKNEIRQELERKRTLRQEVLHS